MKKERGVTLIALSVTVVVLLIILGVSAGAITGEKNAIKEAKENTASAQRESIIEKIEADLYTEKVKLGRMPTEEELINLIEEKEYGIVEENQEAGENMLVSTVGEHEILFSEILGWK